MRIPDLESTPAKGLSRKGLHPGLNSGLSGLHPGLNSGELPEAATSAPSSGREALDVNSGYLPWEARGPS